jgi:CRP/FNR family cyclic AMP-dependent transcriptional regulator
LAFIHADDFFCESSLLEEQRMTVTVQALEPSETLFVPRAALLQAVWQNPAATTAMLRLLLERLQQADRKIQDFALLDVYERVARVLLDASRQEGGEWRVEPGCEQIAQMVAASREMVSRVLKDLAEKGLISRRKRRIVVLDRASIAQRAAARLSRVAQRADAQYYSSPRDGQR